MILNMQFHFHVWTLRPHSTGPRIGLSVKLTSLYPTRMPRREVKCFCCRWLLCLQIIQCIFNGKHFIRYPKQAKILLAFMKGKLSLKIYTPYLIFDLRVSIVLKRHCCAKTLVQQGCTQLRNNRRFPPLSTLRRNMRRESTQPYTAMYTNIFIKNILI